MESLSESHELCVGGDCFEMLQRTEAVLQVIPYVKVRTYRQGHDAILMYSPPHLICVLLDGGAGFCSGGS